MMTKFRNVLWFAAVAGIGGCGDLAVSDDVTEATRGEQSTTNECYRNPLRAVRSLVRERIDQGVDYAGSGAIYAIAPGIIEVAECTSGWPGNNCGGVGAFISYRITAGPAKGKVVYLAENVKLNSALKPGSTVYSGTVLGRLVDESPNCETGWAIPYEDVALAQEYGGYNGSTSTALGINFNQLMTASGAPSGIDVGGKMGRLPPDWPTDWKTLLHTWNDAHCK